MKQGDKNIFEIKPDQTGAIRLKKKSYEFELTKVSQEVANRFFQHTGCDNEKGLWWTITTHEDCGVVDMAICPNCQELVQCHLIN